MSSLIKIPNNINPEDLIKIEIQIYHSRSELAPVRKINYLAISDSLINIFTSKELLDFNFKSRKEDLKIDIIRSQEYYENENRIENNENTEALLKHSIKVTKESLEKFEYMNIFSFEEVSEIIDLEGIHEYFFDYA